MVGEELLECFDVCAVVVHWAHQLKFVCLHHLHQFPFSLEPKPRQDQLDLLRLVLAWKEWRAQQHLGKDAPGRPHVD